VRSIAEADFVTHRHHEAISQRGTGVVLVSWSRLFTRRQPRNHCRNIHKLTGRLSFVISVFAIVILSILGLLFKNNHHEFVGGEEDPKDGPEVAATIFTAVIIYAVCIYLLREPFALDPATAASGIYLRREFIYGALTCRCKHRASSFSAACRASYTCERVAGAPSPCEQGKLADTFSATLHSWYLAFGIWPEGRLWNCMPSSPGVDGIAVQHTHGDIGVTRGLFTPTRTALLRLYKDCFIFGIFLGLD
jgi:hypothetical protein